MDSQNSVKDSFSACALEQSCEFGLHDVQPLCMPSSCPRTLSSLRRDELASSLLRLVDRSSVFTYYRYLLFNFFRLLIDRMYTKSKMNCGLNINP